MSLNAFNNLVLISGASVLIPLILYFRNIKQHSRQHHYIGIMLGLLASFDLLATIAQFNKQPNAIFGNLFILGSFAFITLFYYHIFFRKRHLYLLFSLVAVFCSYTVYALIVSSINVFLFDLWILNSCIIGFYSIIYICVVPSMIIDRFLDKDLYSNVIINTSLSFYFLTTLFLFLSADFVFTTLSASESRVLWSIHNMANIGKNIGLAVGFYFVGKRKTYITLEQLEKMGKEEIRV